MIDFIVFNILTGEIEGNCSYCGIHFVSSRDEFLSYPIPGNHNKLIFPVAKLDMARAFDTQNGQYYYRIDFPNRKMRIRFPKVAFDDDILLFEDRVIA